jgi:hypothetical protein
MRLTVSGGKPNSGQNSVTVSAWRQTTECASTIYGFTWSAVLQLHACQPAAHVLQPLPSQMPACFIKTASQPRMHARQTRAYNDSTRHQLVHQKPHMAHNSFNCNCQRLCTLAVLCNSTWTLQNSVLPAAVRTALPHARAAQVRPSKSCLYPPTAVQYRELIFNSIIVRQLTCVNVYNMHTMCAVASHDV